MRLTFPLDEQMMTDEATLPIGWPHPIDTFSMIPILNSHHEENCDDDFMNSNGDPNPLPWRVIDLTTAVNAIVDELPGS